MRLIKSFRYTLVSFCAPNLYRLSQLHDVAFLTPPLQFIDMGCIFPFRFVVHALLNNTFIDLNINIVFQVENGFKFKVHPRNSK